MYAPSVDSNDKVVMNEVMFQTALAETKINRLIKTLDPEQLAILMNDKDDIYDCLESQGCNRTLDPETVKQLEMQRQDEIIHFQKMHMEEARYNSDHNHSLHETSDIAVELDTEICDNPPTSSTKKDKQTSQTVKTNINFFKSRQENGRTSTTLIGGILNKSSQQPSNTKSSVITPEISPDKPRRQTVNRTMDYHKTIERVNS